MSERPVATAVIVLHQTPPRFSAAPMATSIPALRRILGSLLDCGFRFVGVETVGPEGPPQGSIALTADDGYTSQQEHLGPLLRELKIPWCVFVLAGRLGKANDWDLPWISRPERHLTADEVRRLAGEGVTIGSHGMNHVKMTTLSDAALEAELAESRDRLARLSGQPVDAVAFPWGFCNRRVAAASLAAGYRIGFGVDAGHGADAGRGVNAGHGADTGRGAEQPNTTAPTANFFIPRLGLYAPDQILPAFAVTAIRALEPFRALRTGLEGMGQGLVSRFLPAHAGPRV